MRRTLLTIALSILVCVPASAQQLKLSFNDGLVSLDATGVPVRTILVEWGKLGGTKVIGGDRVSGAVTIKLVDVPESKALEIVLRSVAGYMAAPRSASAAAGASMYDRILVMATSAAPVPAARPTPNPASPPPANQRFVPQRPAPPPPGANDEEVEEEEDPNPPNAPVFTFPQPGQQNGLTQPGMYQPPAGVAGQPVITVNPNTGMPQSITINPAPNPTNPAAVPAFGSPKPGMISAPPAQPPQPGVRPPGA